MQRQIERVTYEREWLDNVVSECRLILTELAKQTFRRYREIGQIILNSGFKKGQWHSKHKRHFCQELDISERTFQRFIQLAEMEEEEFRHAVSEFKSIHDWAYKTSDKKEDSEEFKPQLFNVWNFSGCDERFGTSDFKGRIPGQIVQNVLHYFSDEDDLIVDPMAGGGTTFDVCSFMNRKCLCYDVEPVREEVIQHDIRNGFPRDAFDCDVIFLDPPYHDMIFNTFNDLDAFYSFVEELARNCLETVKPNGVVSLLMGNTNWKADGFQDLSFNCYQRFIEAGFKIIHRVSVPFSSQQYSGFDVEQAKMSKQMLQLVRDLMVFRKVN